MQNKPNKIELIKYILPCVVLGESYIISIFNKLCGTIFKISDMGKTIYFLLFFAFFILGINNIIKSLVKSKAYDVAIVGLLLVSSFVFTTIFSPGTIEKAYIPVTMSNILCYYFPIYVCVRVCLDRELFSKCITISCRILFLFYLNTFSAFFRSGSQASVYSMGFGYGCALSAIILFNSFFENKKHLDIILAIVLTILDIAMGSRGSSLVVVAYLAFKLCEKIVKSKNIIAKCSAGLIIAYCAFNYENLLRSLAKKLKSMGIKSRTLNMFISGEIGDSSGRNNIWVRVEDGLNNLPFFGYGIAGDRQFNGSAYVHNIFLEMILQYGYLMGLTILIILILATLFSFLNKEKRNMTIALGIYTWLYLAVSSSYLLVPVFWIFLGYIFNTSKGATSDENSVC